MARETVLKTSNPVTEKPREDRMPRYEYQKNDSRSFTVTFKVGQPDKKSERDARQPQMANFGSSSLLIV